MALWCESINLTSCLWFADGTERKRVFSAIAAGTLFFVGWWLMIDANVLNQTSVHLGHYICGILGTISLIMVNSVTNQHISGSSLYDGGLIRGNGARIWLFVGFVLGFASVFAAVWICWLEFKHSGAGVEILSQNVLIFVSSMIYKFCRQDDESVF